MVGIKPIRVSQIGLLVLLIAGADNLQAQVELLVLGQGGRDWMEAGERVVGLEDSTAGGLQPWELQPDVNLLVGPRTENLDFTNVFGVPWSLKKVLREGFELGVNPRYWGGIEGTVGGGPQPLIDNDPETVIKVINVPQGSTGRESMFTFDFAFPMPINRVMFFPPDRGIDEEGGLKKQRFPQAFEVSSSTEGASYLMLNKENSFHTLDNLIARTFNNDKRVVDLQFPTELMRFLRIAFNLTSQKYLLGEIQVFGEGFVPTTSYRTVIIPFDQPVNFGRIFWKMEKFSKAGPQAPVQPAPEADITLEVETRTGLDDTPKIYFIHSDFDTEEEVDEDIYNRSPTESIRLGPRPGDRAAVGLDEANWSFWSTPYKRSGQLISSPDGRSYLQLQFRMTAADFRTFGRVDSIAVEYSPLLVEEAVAEVGVQGAEGVAGPTEVPVGVDTTFFYDLQVRFGGQGRLGFDGLRLNVGSDVRFEKLWFGDPAVEVGPDSVRTEDGTLTVYFPSNPIAQSSGAARLRLAFRSSLLNFTTPFLGEIFSLNSDNLPQSVEPGDAGPQVGSDDIRVFAAAQKLDVLAQFEATNSVLTPNGDGRNDAVAFDMTILGVEGAAVEVGVYDLGGRQLRRLVEENRGRGVYNDLWDGRDGAGNLVPPGTYMVRALVAADRQDYRQTRIIAVVY
ncbi:MAG: hypothetical protein GKR89_10140 [Candidatus Latescibacteria bacterium]|nr:hypothetical protein [Candidatus Latescibacterota bacterium]